MKKFELTSEFVTNIFGEKLFRIRALVEFGDVEAGELGGYVEKESNLDHNGNAWVYGDAWVSGNAWVYGDAQVSGNARVSGNAWVSGDARVSGTRHYLNLGPIGSRGGYTTIYRDKSKKAIVVCGCFHGDLDDFERAVHKTHSGTKYEAEYMALIQLARLREKEWLDEVD